MSTRENIRLIARSSFQNYCFQKILSEILSDCFLPGRVAQLVMRLTADTCPTADPPGFASSILARSHTFVEIDHEIISTAFLLPSTDSRRVVVSYKRMYVHEVLVNCLVKLAHEKVW